MTQPTLLPPLPANEPPGQVNRAPRSEAGLSAAVGTIQLLAAQVLGLLAGFAISAVLTRGLGPELYGLYSVAFAVAMWVEISASSMFRHTTIKFLAQADDWRDTGLALMQSELAVTLVGGLGLAVAAPLLARILRSPDLAPLLRLMGLYIPLRGLVHSQSSILLGRGRFGRAALTAFVYWPTRLVLAILLLRLGLSTSAGIWAVIGASVAEAALLAALLRLWPFGRPSFSRRRILGYALPLFFNGLGLRLLTRVDLWLVQARGGDAAAGQYSAAQNVGLIPFGFLGGSLSAPMLSTVSRLARNGGHNEACRIIGNTLRFLFCLLPWVAMASGASKEIVVFLFGPRFLPAAPILAWLLLAGLALDIVNVGSSLLTAAGKPGWNLYLTAPIVPAALLGHWLLVPRYGPVAAAAVTATLACLTAVAATAAMRRLWSVSLPWRSMIRSLAMSAVLFVLSASWSSPGWYLMFKFVSLSVLAVAGYWVLGELRRKDLVGIGSFLPRLFGH